MKSKILPIILLATVILVAGCTQSGQQSTPTPSSQASEQSVQSTTQSVVPTPVSNGPDQPPQATTEPTQQPSTSSVKTFTNEITHSGYSFKDSTGAPVKDLSVKKDDTVVIKSFSSPATHKHGITIDAFNINTEVTGTVESPQEIEFVADKIGTFEIYCKSCLDGVQGAHAWMKSNLIVE